MGLILASASQRRRELLTKISTEFTVIPSGVDEARIQESDPLRFALAAARAKAEDVGLRMPHETVIGADTIVVLDNTIFGKPKGIDEARIMLQTLSGTTHLVITALALYKHDEHKLLLDYQTSAVTFKKLTGAMIEDYLATGDFSDKAGSYAIQVIGDTFVSAVEGDYDNVVGLPVERLRDLLNAFAAETFTLEVVDIALPDGFGVAKRENGVIFIPRAVTGDVATVTLVKEKPRLALARLRGLAEPSASRITPQCPYSGICGGCILQEVDYPEQLRLKERHLYQTIARIGKIDISRVAQVPMTPAHSRYFYRNKIELSFATHGNTAILGFTERNLGSPGGETIIPIHQCPIASPKVNGIISRVLGFIEKAGLAAYDAQKKTGALKRLIVKEAKDSEELMVILVTKPAPIERYSQHFYEALSSIEQVQSLYWVIEERDGAANFDREVLIAGEKCIRERVGKIACNVYPETFLQANSATAALLYGYIKKNIGCAEKILSLYCGSGVLELAIASEAQEITGIDSNIKNIACARENAQLNNITNCTFSPGRAEEMLKKQTRGYSILIVDPPRAGLDPETLRRALIAGMEKIVYVSCNPATLARDLAALARHYRIMSIAGFDMFPQTGHLEAVALLHKK